MPQNAHTVEVSSDAGNSAGARRPGSFPLFRLVALSSAAATLLYVSSWVRLGLIPGDIEYHVKVVNLSPAIYATLLNTLIAALLFFCLGFLGLRTGKARSRRFSATFLLVLFAFGIVRTLMLLSPLDWTKPLIVGNAAMLGFAIAVAILVGVTSRLAVLDTLTLLSRAVPVAIIWLAMFSALVAPVFATLFRSPSPGPEFDPPLANRGKTLQSASDRRTPHILWIIFDEFDASVTFDHRHPSIQLPHLDQFRQESISFSRAYSPSDFTVTAVPSLFTGEHLSSVVRKEYADLTLTTEASEKHYSFRQTPSIISWANQAGVSTSVIGWTHPYCRVFADQLAQCAWYENDFVSMSQIVAASYRRLSLWEGSAAQAFQESFPYTGDPCATSSPSARLGRESYEEMRDRIRQIVTSQRSDAHRFLTSGIGGLHIFHFATPHLPAIALQPDETSDKWLQGDQSIAANFAIADRIFGEIRALMEQREEWDTSLVIVTSDHGLRSFWTDFGCLTGEDQQILAHRDEFHVPLMIRWPNAAAARTVDQKVSTLIIAPLVRDFMNGRLQSWEEFDTYLHSLTQGDVRPGKSE